MLKPYTVVAVATAVGGVTMIIATGMKPNVKPRLLPKLRLMQILSVVKVMIGVSMITADITGKPKLSVKLR